MSNLFATSSAAECMARIPCLRKPDELPHRRNAIVRGAWIAKR